MPSPGAVRAGEAYVEISAANTKLEAGLKSAAARMRRFGSSVAAAGLGMMKFGAVAAAPFVAAVKSFTTMGDSVADMSRRTGIAASTLSELRFAAEQTGTTLDGVEKGVKKMQMSINDLERGLTTAKDAFGTIGLSIESLRSLTPEQQFKRIADGISRISDPSKRAAVALQIFGRAGTELLGMFEHGSAGIEELQAKARALGLTISDEAAANADRFSDILNVLGHEIKGVGFSIAEALMPTLLEMVSAVREGVRRLAAWIRTHKDLVVWIAKTVAQIAAMGAALWAVGKVIGFVAGAYKVLTLAIKLASVAKAFLLMLEGPKGWLILGAAIIGTAVAYKFLSSKLQEVREDLERAEDAARGAASGIREAGKAAKEAGDSMIRETVDGMTYEYPRHVTGSSQMTMSDWQAIADDRARAERQRIERTGTVEQRWAQRVHDMRLGLIDQEVEARVAAEQKLAEMASAFLGAYRAQLDDIARRTRRGMSDWAHPREIREDFYKRARELRANYPRFVREMGVDVRGTFNPAALQSMQSGPTADYAKRTAKATEESAKRLGRIEKNTDGDVLIGWS
jgi:hypothetical protein